MFVTETKVTWSQRMSFTGTGPSGFSLPLGTDPDVGGDDDGFRPMELVGIALAGCTAMDVISILRKKQQDVTAFEVLVHGERSDEHPKVYTKMVVEYLVDGHHVDPAAVERAIELSFTKYCPVQAMLSKSAPVEHIYTIREAA